MDEPEHTYAVTYELPGDNCDTSEVENVTGVDLAGDGVTFYGQKDVVVFYISHARLLKIRLLV